MHAPWRQAGAVAGSLLRYAVPAAVILLTGLALAYLPLTWAAALVLGSGVLILISIHPVVGLYLVIFAIPFGSLKEIGFGVIRIGGAEALAAITLGAWLIRMAVRREISTVHPPLLLPLLAYLGVACLSLLDAASLQWALKGLLIWLELLAVYLLVANLLDGRQVDIAVILILLAGSLEALLGFYQFLGRRGPEGFLLFGRFIRAYGTFDQPNPYGGYLGLILPLALSVFLCYRRWRGFWPSVTWAVAGVSLALIGGALVMSWSRGAWLGFATALILVGLAGFWHRAFSHPLVAALAGSASAALTMLWYGDGMAGWVLGSVYGGLAGIGTGVGVWVALRRRWIWLLLGLGALMGAVFLALGGARLIPALVGERFSDIIPYVEMPDVRGVHVTDENYALVERLAHWQAALGMLNDHPLLGVGVGNYVPAYPNYALPGWKDPLGHAHNYYLNVAAETGLLGLGVYLFFVSGCFWHLWHVLARVADHRRGIALGILGVLGAFAVHSLFDDLYVHGMNMHLAILLGLAYVIGKRPEVSLVEAS